MTVLHPDYIKLLNALKDRIKRAQIKAATVVNAELLKLYWEIGTTIHQQEQLKGWGAKVVDQLSKDLLFEFPEMKGFSKRNLRYMREFALAYPEFDNSTSDLFLQQAVAISGLNDMFPILQQLVAKLPWGHHIVILTKLKEKAERVFYIEKCIENNWSRDVLIHQIEGQLHKRVGNSIHNFKDTLPTIHSDLAAATLKNPYIFDFLSMGEKIQERDFENALIKHLKEFMLELGKGFAFVGNQKNVNVEGDDYFLDLLFYNYNLHCFVVFELKMGDFKPEYAGKLNFYVNAVNEQLKGEKDEATIGVLLCKTPNETVIKYSLKNIEAPIGVANYILTNSLPKKLKSEMPTFEELEAEIDKEIKELKKPVETKYDRIKDLISGLKQPTVTEQRTPETIERIFKTVILPIKDAVKKAIEKIGKEFSSVEIMIWTDNQGHATDEAAIAHLNLRKVFNDIRIDVQLKGFKAAGLKAFTIWKEICITTNEYSYTIVLNRHQPQAILLEKLYHELPEKVEIGVFVENFLEQIYDDIEQQIERIKKELN